MAEPNYEIRVVSSAYRLNKLKLRQEDGGLGAFLQRSCINYHENNLAKTYVYIDTNTPAPQKVCAYISVLVSEVKNEDTELTEFEGFRFPYPAMKIARLAVDRPLQKTGLRLGQNLVSFVIAMAKRNIMPNVGCRFVMVDANKPAVEFYRKCGFVLVDTPENISRSEPVMFYDLQKVT